MPGLKLQFISRVTAEPNARGNATYMLDVMENLRLLGVNLDFVLLETRPGEPAPPSWDAPPTAGELAFAQERMAAFGPEVVMVNYMYLADILDLAPTGAKRAILTHDVCCLRHESFCREGARLDGTVWSRECEAERLAKAELLVAIQPQEAATLRQLAPAAQVVVTPMTIAPRPAYGPTAQAVPGRCLFVGSDADHNRFSLLWFLDEVWPLVLAQRPDAFLSVCGTVNHRIKRQFPRAALHGRVEDLSGEYAAAEVCVVPLRVGSGLEIKLVEGMGRGKPCVVSSRGINALPEDCREAVLRGESPDEFAAAVVRGLNDPALRAELSRRALACVAAHFDPRKAYAPLAAALGLS